MVKRQFTPRRGILHRFVHARCGTSAIEFALIVTPMLILYIGAVDLNNALTLYQRSLQVATTAADLTAQVKSVTSEELGQVQDASESIFAPYSTTDLVITLSSVVADDNNTGKVDWSCSRGGDPNPKGTTFAVPEGLTEPNSSVIVAEVTYKFKPLLGLEAFWSPGPFSMEQTFYSRPRRSLTVKKSDNGCPGA